MAAIFVMIVAMVSVVGAAYWASGSREVKRAIPVAAPVAATAVAPVKAYVAEAPLKPVNCVAWYNVLVDAGTAGEVRKVTLPAVGKSEFYELRRGKGEAVRELLKGAEHRTGGYLRNFEVKEKGGFSGWPMDQVMFHDFPVHRGNSIVGMNFPDAMGEAVVNGEGVKVKVDFDAQEAWASEWNVADAKTIQKKGTVHFDGELAGDEALVMLGDFGDFRGGHPVSVTVHEVYQADASEAVYLSSGSDAEEWLRNGPAVMRGRADVCLAWVYGNEQGAGALAATERQWTRNLKDGTKVVLKRVGRPSVWPQCWWDANGGATRDSSFIYHEGSAVVQAVVNVESPFGRSGRADIPMDQRLWVEEGFPLAEGENRVTVYVSMGPWEVKRIEVGDAVEVEGGYVEFKKGTWTGETTCDVEMAGEVGLETEVALAAGTKDGKWVPLINDFMGRSRVAGVTKEADGMTKLSNTYGGVCTMPVKREAFDHWVLLKRPRGERVVFEGFAMEPVVKPRESVTKEEVAAALKKADWRIEHAAGLGAEEEAERWDAIPRDETVPVGAMRVLVDKARAGDVAGVKAMMTGKDAERMEMAAEWFTTSEVLLRKCEEKFGRMEMLEAFWKKSVSISMGDELLNGWEVTGDEATEENRRFFLVKQGGKWRLDTDRMEVEGMTVAEMRKKMAEMKGKVAVLERDLDGGKIGSAEEAVKRVTRVVFGG